MDHRVVVLALIASGLFNPSASQTICREQPTACSCVIANGVDAGKTIDLASVANGPGTSPRFNVQGQDGFVYFYNPCYDASVPSTACANMAACQLWQSVYSVIGYNVYAQFREDARGRYIWYQGDNNDFSEPRITQVYLVCDQTKLEPQLVVEGDMMTPYVYIMELRSKFACAEGEDPGPPSGGSGMALSIGSIMCIVALVVIILYFVIGVGYMRGRHHATGIELIPNVEFWKSFPGLIKDGGLFIVEKFRGLRGGGEEGSSEYEKL